MAKLKKGNILICIGMGIGICLVLARPLTAKEVFRGKLLTSGGPTQEKMMTVKINIDEFTTAVESLQFKKILAEEGGDPFFKAFRKSKKGYINFIGVQGLNVTINAAYVKATEKGRKIIIFTDRQNWGGTERFSNKQQYLFMVMELDLNTDGKGTGKFYPGASIKLDNDGTILLDEFLPLEQILGIRKIG